jgi:hypothetical protein
MTDRLTAGYSGTPLTTKLGIKEGSRVLVVGSPIPYARLLGEVPRGVQLVARAGAGVDVAHVFSTRKADMVQRLTRLRDALRPDASIWVSWPKKTAKVPTDITEDVIREVAFPLGFVDIKVCAVTDVWSGLKLVVRKELR